MKAKYSYRIVAWIAMFFPGWIFAQTHIREGEVSGLWTKASSPYIIDGNITVVAGTALIIREGTTILFNGPFHLEVYGDINATGEEKNPVIFSFTDTVSTIAGRGWRGIKLIGKAGQKDSAQFTWCSFSYGNATGGKVENCRGGAVFAESRHYLKISRCSFMQNTAVAGGAVYARSTNMILEGCGFEKNRSMTDGGAMCLVSCNAKIFNNILLNNEAYSRGGAIIAEKMKASIANNVITENRSRFGAGIALVKDTSLLINNTIADNISGAHGGGIHLEKSGTKIINTILWGNQSKKEGPQAYLFREAVPRFWFSNLEDGTEGIALFTDGYSRVGEDYNNFDQDPVFLQDDTSYYSLSEGSPCIDFGIPDTSSLYLPKTDAAKRFRIGGNRIDMGAYEYGAALLDDEMLKELEENEDKNDGKKPQLKLLAYPNPSEGAFRVLVSNPEHKRLMLKITSASGNVIVESPIKDTDEVFILPIEIRNKPGIYIMNITDNLNRKLKEKKVVVN